MIVALVRLTLLLSYSHSLKEKRNALRKLKDRAQARLAVRLIEVGGHDTWQRAVCGFAVVGVERSAIENRVDQLLSLLENAGVAEVARVEREIVYFGDEEQ